jgi:chemotaxis protein CheX
MKATATSPTRSKDRSAWLPILKQSIDEVFEVMLGYRLETPSEADKPEALEFTALVGLAGELCGVVIFRCSAHSAVRMTSKMLGLNVDPPEAQVWDAVGELCNVIAGNFKNKLPGIAERCLLSIPTVVIGANCRFHSLADSCPMEVQFGFEGTTVVVTVEVHS